MDEISILFRLISLTRTIEEAVPNNLPIQLLEVVTVILLRSRQNSQLFSIFADVSLAFELRSVPVSGCMTCVSSWCFGLTPKLFSLSLIRRIHQTLRPTLREKLNKNILIFSFFLFAGFFFFSVFDQLENILAMDTAKWPQKTLSVNNKTPPPPLQQLNLTSVENDHEAKAYSHGFGNAHEAKDLSSAFSQGFGIGHHHQSIPEFLQVVPSSMKSHALVSTSSALELLGISNSSTTSSNSRPAFVTYPNVHDSSVYAAASPGFGMSYPQFQEFMRPPLGFPLDGGDPLRQQEGSSGTDIGRPLLPFESLKLPVSSSSTNSGGGGNGNDHKREKEEGEADNSVGFWNGMLSAGDSAASAGGPWQ
ncbi:unnamed protein product [Brassica rapa subsp. trilocularis]